MNDESIVVLLGLGVLVYFLFIKKEKRVMTMGKKMEELGYETETPLYPNPYV